MIVQQIKVNKFVLTLVDTSVKSPWIKKAKLKRYLSACLPIFEDFILNRSGINLKALGVKEVELSLTLCGEKKITGLNLNYRQKNKKTDVLSFPIHENLRCESEQIFMSLLNLGDIIICKDVAKRQAASFKITPEEEVTHLLVHGFLHVLGYDHEISLEEENIMQDLEKKILNKISKKLKRP